jgi:hypothetical protein
VRQQWDLSTRHHKIFLQKMLTVNEFVGMMCSLNQTPEQKMSRFSRRTTQERMAESAVYRARTDTVVLPTISLDKCEYDRNRKVLKLSSEFIGMPLSFFVKSHHTGKEVRFVPVTPADVLFDQDGWDGEQQIYRPVGNVSNVDHLVIYHQW